MRPIKFRAWDNDRNLWENRFVTGPGTDGKFMALRCCGNSTVEQFTGLHDKNGREIYEGDILEMFPDSGAAEAGRTEPQKVIWSAPCFTLQRPNGHKTFFVLDPSVAKSSKVIGNVHENSEMLK